MSVNEPVFVQLVVNKSTNSVEIIKISDPRNNNNIANIDNVDAPSFEKALSYDHIFKIKRHSRKTSIPIKFDKPLYIE